MKNICFLIGDINHSGGTERVTTLIANTLDKKQNNIFVLSLSNGDKPFFELNKDIRVAALFKEKISMKKHFFQCVKRIRKFLIENKIDTLIVVDSISCVFTVPACMGIKINHICWEHFNFNINLGSRFRNFGRRLAALFCSKIVVLTKQDVIYWNKNIFLKKAKIIHVSNPTSFDPIYKLPNFRKKNILTVGRLDYIKGFDILIEAFSILRDENEEWSLTIVGSGEEEKKLKNLSKKLGLESCIHFVGATKHLDQYFRNASFFCCSSRFEGFGMVILEAMSYGLPVISFDCDCGPREIIDSSFGILVKDIDSKKLAMSFSEFIKLSDSKYEIMSINAYNTSKNYSLENVSKVWLEII